MIEETAELMVKGIKQGININVIINNRTGGNAPMIAKQVAKRFLLPEKKLVKKFLISSGENKKINNFKILLT